MHFVEDILVLAANAYTDGISELLQAVSQFDIFLVVVGICHHHVKEALNDGLGNIQNVHVVLCKIGADLAMIPTVSFLLP